MKNRTRGKVTIKGLGATRRRTSYPCPAHFRPKYCLVLPETSYLPNLDAFIKIRVVLQIFLAITAHFNQACSRALPLWAAI